jgi:thiol-disulfide isomerase/thioredoxin
VIGACWCPECRQEAPEVQKAYLEYKDKGVAFLYVLAVSKDEEIREFVETYKITYPVAKDNGVVGILGVRAIPQTFFFSKGGKFEKRIMGVATHKELTRNIEKIMAK